MSVIAQIEELSFSHPRAEFPALERVSLCIPAGAAVALLGSSGAGKTTLLTLLDGRLRGWRGHVSVLGEALDPDHAPPRVRRADTGFIFQEFALVERSTVLRNVLNGRLGRMPLLRGLLGKSSQQRDVDICMAALSDCGIADLAERRVDSLSGGQRQRVAIARCLAQEPRMILADEPVNNLDPARAANILTLLCGAARARGATVLFSSHQLELAQRFADRIVGMRNGRIVLDVPATDLNNEAMKALYHDVQPLISAPLQMVS